MVVAVAAAHPDLELSGGGGGGGRRWPGLDLLSLLAPVVRRLGNAIHRINHYPPDSVVCFVNTYLLDSDLSGG